MRCPRSKAPPSEAEKFVSRLSFRWCYAGIANNGQIWRFPNLRRVAEIQDPLMASLCLAEDLDHLIGGEVQLIVVLNSNDCPLVISATNLLGEETTIAH